MSGELPNDAAALGRCDSLDSEPTNYGFSLKHKYSTTRSRLFLVKKNIATITRGQNSME